MGSNVVDYSIRRATSDDHDAIINIRHDVYEGLDYVPALLKQMLQTHQGFVATIENKIVSIRFKIFPSNTKN